ncbi:MAG: hypothetical protein Q4D13_04125 [Erysipelotrichaceae bacterium]|nr:hypothetical protein [Erysipelotrichaceae bacterium]
MKNKLLKFILLLLILITGALVYLLFSNEEASASYIINPDNTLSITISGTDISKCTIAISDTDEISEDIIFETYDQNKRYELNDNENYILIKDRKGNIIPIETEETVSLSVNKDYLPLYPIDECIVIDYTCTSIGSNNLIITSDTDAVEITDNQIYTLSKGIANITIESNSKKETFTIEVTDLYTRPNADSDSKPILKELLITDPEEAAKLDEVLRIKIEEAGFGTRAGVVAAARFLALEFPYKIAYFSEGGRLDPVSSVQSDGEGRYYHYGLFLSEDKFDDLGPSLFGRATWGEFFDEDDNNDHSMDEIYLTGGLAVSDIGTHLYLSKRPNGLDCSGHVSWCYYNGGFDFGDLGAGGPGSHGMSELGELVYITDELLQSDRIKAGDLVGFVGHIGIVIGVDEEHIWISDNLITGLKNTCYERTTQSFEELAEEPFEYFILMDSEYKEDGNYTAMWEE